MQERFIKTIVMTVVTGLMGIPIGWAQHASQSAGLTARMKAALSVASEKAEKEQSATKKAPVEQAKNWDELVRQILTPFAVPKKDIVRIDEHFAYPQRNVPLKMEIVKEEGDMVWLRGLPPEDPDSIIHELWIMRQQQDANFILSREFEEMYGFGDLLDFHEAIVPPPTVDAVAFEESDGGLPKNGKWQMGFDIADMNADGNLDLVFPPARKGTPAHPWIYLGDGKGGFRQWNEPKWTTQVPYDYGDIKVADFDGDGFLDVILAIHFKSQYVLYGSSTHEFARFKKLPIPDPRLSARSVALADFDRDGRIDCAFEAEINLDMQRQQKMTDRPTVWIVHNTEKGWKLAKKQVVNYVFGDKINAGDFNGDGLPDLALGANYSGWRGLMYLQQNDGSWKSWNQRHIYRSAYHFDVEPFCDAEGACTMYAAMEQFSRPEGKETKRSALVRYRPEKKNDWETVKPELISMIDPGANYYFRVEAGDLNGDGLEDLVVARKTGGLEVWIQVEGGEFYKNLPNGLETSALVFSIKIVDVDGDGFRDIVAGTADLETGPGGVRIWLSHPKG